MMLIGFNFSLTVGTFIITLLFKKMEIHKRHNEFSIFIPVLIFKEIYL